MTRRPSFQFYPADWRKESGLLFCSMGARGLWIEMLCIMHEGEPYGHLTYRGKTLTPASLARLLGENPLAVKRWYKELEEHEVFSITDDGTPYSRRMVRDEAVREKRAAGGEAGKEHGHKGAQHGHKGGRPRAETPVEDGAKGGNKPPSTPEQKPPPSTSSSSASSFEGKYQAQPPIKYSNSEPHVRTCTRAADCFNEICIAAGWTAANDTQRQNALNTIDGWLALGCSVELIEKAIAAALRRDPSPTKSLRRFDTTVRGMRRDEAGELPPTRHDIAEMTATTAKRLSVG